MPSTSVTPGHSSRVDLRRLLSERNQRPERSVEIDQTVWRAFGRRAAVLALDMCGFSRLTAEHGIIHFLAMIQQMDDAARPAVTSNGGQVIKQEADNLFALFSRPADALEAALDIFRAFEAMNSVLPEVRDIYGSIGIGYGDLLVLENEDVFGDEMNAACRLGEDLAARMEILLTPAAHAAIPARRYAFTADSFLIRGSEIRCFRFERRLQPATLGRKTRRTSPALPVAKAHRRTRT